MPRVSIISCTSLISAGHFWISSMQTTLSRRPRASTSRLMRVGSASTAVSSPRSSSVNVGATASRNCRRT